MKESVCRNLVLWLLVLGLSGLTAFWTNSPIVLTAMFLWLLTPLVSTCLNLYICRHLQLTAALPASAEKGAQTQGTLRIVNSGKIPFAGLFCEISIENCLTQETESVTFAVSGENTGIQDIPFEIVSVHCGYLKASVSAAWLMDWIGFIPFRCQGVIEESREAGGELSGEAVLPDTFSPHIYLNPAQIAQEEADNWSMTQKGNDQTEIFSLRDYVSGDNLKQIHWKLSSKRGKLIIREPSLPIEKSLLLFWDKNTEKASPVEMDAMAECAASVSQAILNAGYSFMLGWTEGREMVFENIENEDDLLQAIPQMVKYGPELSRSGEVYRKTSEENIGRFGKVIYLAKSVSENFQLFSCADRTCLLCGNNEAAGDYHIVPFKAACYREDLAAIEL